MGPEKVCFLLVLAATAAAAPLVSGTRRLLTDGSSAQAVSNGRQLAVALADLRVGLITITADIYLADSDWEGLGDLPFLRTTNVTILGTPIYKGDEDIFAIDGGYVRDKIRLAPGVSMTIEGVVLTRYREDLPSSTPGLDLLAPSEKGAGVVPPSLLLVRVAINNRLCFPENTSRQSVIATPRPAMFPGVQNTTVEVPQPDCVNSTTAPWLRRCWSVRREYISIATMGAAFGPTGRPEATNYYVVIVQMPLLCDAIMSAECISLLGPLGCYVSTFPKTPRPPPLTAVPPSPAPNGGNVTVQYGSAPSSTASSGNATTAAKERKAILLGAVLGSVLGTAVMVAAAAAIVAVRRGWRPFTRPGASSSSAGGGSLTKEADRSAEVPFIPASLHAFSNGEDGGGSGGNCDSGNEQRSGDIASLHRKSSPRTSHSTDARSGGRGCGGCGGDGGGDGGGGGGGCSCGGSDGGSGGGGAAVGSGRTPVGCGGGAIGGGGGVGGGYGGRAPGGSGGGASGGGSGGAGGGSRRTPVGSGGGASGGGGGVGGGDGGRAPGGSGGGASGGGCGVGGGDGGLAPGGSGGGGCGGETPGALFSTPQPCIGDFALPSSTLLSLLLPESGAASAAVEGAGAGGGGGGGEDGGDHIGLKEGSARALADGKGFGSSGSVASLNGVFVWVDPAMPVTALTPRRTDMKLLGADASNLNSGGSSGGGGNGNGRGGGGGGAQGDVAAEVDNEVKLLPDAVLGKGSFGRVVEGTYQGQRVAVKLVHDAHTFGGMSESVLHSFGQEVEVLGRCQHPNVVRLLAACLTPPRLCLVMELMETSLEQVLYAQHANASVNVGVGVNAVGGAKAASILHLSISPNADADAVSSTKLLPLPTVLFIALEIAKGLEYLHPTIVHRDLKPGNVLINDPWGVRPVVKITDFGLARLRSTAVPTRTPDAGTPAYLAPEGFDASNFIITHHADIYSMAVLLWEMLAADKPWRGRSIMEVALMTTTQGARLPVDWLPDSRCPPKLKALVKQMWEQDPRRRPAAAEVVKSLALILQEVQHGSDSVGLPSSNGGSSNPNTPPPSGGPRPKEAGPPRRVLTDYMAEKASIQAVGEPPSGHMVVAPPPLPLPLPPPPPPLPARALPGNIVVLRLSAAAAALEQQMMCALCHGDEVTLHEELQAEALYLSSSIITAGLSPAANLYPYAAAAASGATPVAVAAAAIGRNPAGDRLPSSLQGLRATFASAAPHAAVPNPGTGAGTGACRGAGTGTAVGEGAGAGAGAAFGQPARVGHAARLHSPPPFLVANVVGGVDCSPGTSITCAAAAGSGNRVGSNGGGRGGGLCRHSFLSASVLDATDGGGSTGAMLQHH